MFSKTILAAMLAASAGTFAAPAFANHDFRSHGAPQARHGYVWVPGHWERVNHRHVWVEGMWVRERNYYAARRDRDGDGVPNRFDRRPNDPRFY